jgi:hypothetical protein
LLRGSPKASCRSTFVAAASGFIVVQHVTQAR